MIRFPFSSNALVIATNIHGIRAAHALGSHHWEFGTRWMPASLSPKQRGYCRNLKLWPPSCNWRNLTVVQRLLYSHIYVNTHAIWPKNETWGSIHNIYHKLCIKWKPPSPICRVHASKTSPLPLTPLLFQWGSREFLPHRVSIYTSYRPIVQSCSDFSLLLDFTVFLYYWVNIPLWPGPTVRLLPYDLSVIGWVGVKETIPLQSRNKTLQWREPRAGLPF